MLSPCVILPRVRVRRVARGGGGGWGGGLGEAGASRGGGGEGLWPHDTHRQSSSGTPLEGIASTLGLPRASHAASQFMHRSAARPITCLAAQRPSTRHTRHVTVLGAAPEHQAQAPSPPHTRPRSPGRLAAQHLPACTNNQQQWHSAASPPRRVSGGRGAAGHY